MSSQRTKIQDGFYEICQSRGMICSTNSTYPAVSPCHCHHCHYQFHLPEVVAERDLEQMLIICYLVSIQKSVSQKRSRKDNDGSQLHVEASFSIVFVHRSKIQKPSKNRQMNKNSEKKEEQMPQRPIKAMLTGFLCSHLCYVISHCES